MANPLKSLIKREKDALENYSLISCCGFDRSGQQESITHQLADLTEHLPKAVCELQSLRTLSIRAKRGNQNHFTLSRHQQGSLEV